MCGRGLRRSHGRRAAGATSMGRRLGASHLSLFRRRQEQFQRNPDSYNGAVRENYTWSQDYTDLELKVPVPKHVVKGRQVTMGLLRLLRAASFFGHRHRGWPPCLPEAPASPAVLRGCTWWRAVRGHCCTVGHSLRGVFAGSATEDAGWSLGPCHGEKVMFQAGASGLCSGMWLPGPGSAGFPHGPVALTARGGLPTSASLSRNVIFHQETRLLVLSRWASL